MNSITILPGFDKVGTPEPFSSITIKSGTLLAIVGNTGSGKSRLIQDIEQLACGDSVSRRKILLNGCTRQEHSSQAEGLIAHLGQNMRFMLDTTVAEFIALHSQCREKAIDPQEVIAAANGITPEKITPEMHLNLLSGGQTRALMVADIALICDSPIVLMDEIENAGINKMKAFSLLLQRDKVLILVTHDPHTALMANQRIVLRGGGIAARLYRTPQEEQLYHEMTKEYEQTLKRQFQLRNGEMIT